MDLPLRLARDCLVLDGCMESLLTAEGVDPGVNHSELNLLDPELVSHVHQRFASAGADCLTTNTLDASPLRLVRAGIVEQMIAINQAGLDLARALRPQHILAAIAPQRAYALGDAAEAAKQVECSLRAQAEVLVEGAPDALLLDGFGELGELKLALQVLAGFRETPLVVSFSLAGVQSLVDGSSLNDAVALCQGAGVCALGIADAPDLESALASLQALTKLTALPIYLEAPALLADAIGVEPQPATAQQSGTWAEVFRQHGASMIGFGRAATSLHCAAAYASVGGTDRVLVGLAKEACLNV
ncbi:MAG: homocysteine S-methyltransferase family protein [Coriobacteriales bacterium]|jgi:methionine synthase I (cobalamin-dependent)|nr:homocysteine S-methyltransferase family protein [Coriobacteriales bacterium]